MVTFLDIMFSKSYSPIKQGFKKYFYLNVVATLQLSCLYCIKIYVSVAPDSQTKYFYTNTEQIKARKLLNMLEGNCGTVCHLRLSWLLMWKFIRADVKITCFINRSCSLVCMLKLSFCAVWLLFCNCKCVVVFLLVSVGEQKMLNFI